MNRQFISTLIGVVVLDQYTKYLAQQAGAVNLNQGVSFGVITTETQLLLSAVIILIMITLWQWRRGLWQRYPVLAGFFFGGGVANVVDRLVYGGVRDWLPVPFVNLTNNLADWAITVAIAGLLLLELKGLRIHQLKKNEKSTESESDKGNNGS